MIAADDPLGWLSEFNPFAIVGQSVGNVVADGWTGIMLSLWAAGLWVLKFALGFMDRFLTPDITDSGPAAGVYQTTLWASGAMVVIMALVQLGVAAVRRDGGGLARVVIGIVQFTAVWAAWITYGVALLAACSGLTQALMRSLLGIDSWAKWSPMGQYDYAKSSIETTLATVLGVLGIFLWVAAIGHFIVMLARAAALLILAAVTPIAAAGLVSESGRTWFWKSLRWFHAAALTPVLCVLVLGLGIQLTTGTAQGAADSPEAAVGTALPGVMLILISVVAPVALFKLLAFVDPGTTSGAAMRAGMVSAGGIQGLLGGDSSDGTTGAASSSNGMGQAQGEAKSNEATSGRFGSAIAALTGPAGGAYAAGLGALTRVGAMGAAIGVDNLNQTGVGDSSYFPDYQPRPQQYNPDQRDPQSNDAGSHTPPLPRLNLPDAPSPGAGGSTAGAAAADIPPVA